MVFQSPVLLPWRTVVENVVAPAEILGIADTSARLRAEELLAKVGLAGFETPSRTSCRAACSNASRSVGRCCQTRRCS